jgi:hypothetical protein
MTLLGKYLHSLPESQSTVSPQIVSGTKYHINGGRSVLVIASLINNSVSNILYSDLAYQSMSFLDPVKSMILPTSAYLNA